MTNPAQDIHTFRGKSPFRMRVDPNAGLLEIHGDGDPLTFTEEDLCTARALVEEIDAKKTSLQELPVHKISSIAGILISRPDIQTYCSALYEVWTRGSHEDREDFFKNQYSYAYNFEVDEEESIEVFGNLSPEEVTSPMGRLANTLILFWDARNKGNPAPARPEKW